MLRKYYLTITAAIILPLIITGCTQFTPDSRYNTQASLSAMEYTISANKEIGLVLNLLEEHMTNGKNVLKNRYPVTDEIDNLNHTLIMVKEAIDSIDRLLPPDSYEDDRLDTLRRMENARETLESYAIALESSVPEELSVAIDLMGGDFAALKGSFNIQWE